MSTLDSLPAAISTTDPSPPPLLADAEPDTHVELPHATWHERWRPALAAFADASGSFAGARRVSYEPLPLKIRLRDRWTRMRTGHGLLGLYTSTWHVPVGAVRDAGLRAELMELVRAFYHYELPKQDAVMLTGMIEELGDSTLELLGWLRAALCEIAGDRHSAIAAPTGFTGSLEPDQPSEFEPHSDMWIPALLFNIFNDAVPGEGATTLLPMVEMWDVVAGAGMPGDAIEQLQEAQVEAGECDYYEQFNGLLYKDHPWSEAVKEALFDASVEVHLGRGQGYFVNDRVWLHGRTALMPGSLPEDRRHHRLYRLAYNNERLEREAGERRIEWERVGRTAAGCKV
jgi:hypothetical protein